MNPDHNIRIIVINPNIACYQPAPMKYIVLLLCVITLTWSCSQPKPESNDLSQAEVNELMNQWLDLWATYDVNKLENIFWNDPQHTYFSSEKRGLIKGFDQMKPHHEGFGFFAGGKQPSKSLWLDETNITIHPGFAAVEAIWYFGDRSLPQDSVQNGPVTFVVIKDKEGKAKIAHTHFGNYE